MLSFTRYMLTPYLFSFHSYGRTSYSYVFWVISISDPMVVTSVLIALPIWCHYALFEPVCSPRVRFCFNLGNLALLTMQQYCDMATLHTHCGLLSCTDPRQYWSLDSPYVSSHTHLDTPALTYLWHSTGLTEVSWPPLQRDAADTCSNLITRRIPYGYLRCRHACL